MKVSPNFNRSEFSCQCKCAFNAVDVSLLSALEDVRFYFSETYPNKKIFIKITSGNRCETHNRSVGGASNSQHTKGMAADFIVNSIPAKEVYDYLDNKYPNWFGIGLYSNRVHLDVRSTPARWVGND